MAWMDYVKRVAGSDTPSDIARRTGLGPSSVTRWQISAPKPDNIRAFAKAYNRPVLEAFVEAGLLTQEEADVTTLPADLAEVDSDALLAEIRRRLPS